MYKFIWDLVKYKIYYEIGYNNLDDSARELRIQAEQLNTVWKKFCQTLSCRDDLMGPVFAREMKTLLDNCPHHDHNYTDQILSEEMPGEVFSTPFTDEYLIGSGTIAQVYKSYHDGLKRWVAVKVKHPNIHADIDEAFEQYKLVSSNSWFPANLVNSGYTFFNHLNQQANFEMEYESCNKMKAILHKIGEKSDNPYIFILPEMIKCSYSVILMTYEPGDYDYPSLDDTGIKDQVGLIMMHLQVISLDNGILHSDLHWGNFSIRLDPLQIILYDFGWVIDISDKPDHIRRAYATAFLTRDIIGIFRLMMTELNLEDIDYHIEQMQSIIDNTGPDALTSSKMNRVLVYYQTQGLKYDNGLLAILYAFVHCDPLEKNITLLPTPDKIHTMLPYAEFHNLVELSPI